MGHAAFIAPVRLKVWDEALGVDKIITTGYQGYCPCGRQTGQEDTYAAARRALIHHKAHDHGHQAYVPRRKRRSSRGNNRKRA